MESIIDDYDSINLELEEDSTFEFGIVNTYNLPENCNLIHKKEDDIYFSSRNVLYKLIADNKYGQKKLRERIIGFLPLGSEYPLLALICKTLKCFKLQINNNHLILEKYKGRCDASVLYLGLAEESMAVCVYKTEEVVKYCTIGIEDTNMMLLRKEILSKDVKVKFDSSLYMNCYLLSSEHGYTVFKLNRLNGSLEPSVATVGRLESKLERNHTSEKVVEVEEGLKYKLVKYELEAVKDTKGPRLVKLINNNILCFVRLSKEDLIISFHEINIKGAFKTIKLNTHGLKQTHTDSTRDMQYYRGVFNVLIESEDSRYSVLSFSEEMPTETISYHDPYTQMPTTKELERLIETSEIVITRKLVDYLISNKAKSCCKKILKCVHIPEADAVRILKNDISLLEDFMLYTRCSESELKRALKSEMDSITFKKILHKLLEMMERYYNKRIIKMINVMLDAKVVEVEEFDENILEGLQNMVEGCQKEQMDLQSLLSFTNTLLDSKIKANTNPLITSVEISLE
ncbi:conserved hypothetical protein [Theileria orientalis strain Shintoku]|uniref:Uncharacterized protein n=1 Tax=Theileria orientalis strain Shintoku TaxID=869250 RepID=J4C805_THEOR|nr:conserved hypothetical protein [Theileria orientalis strain Shintoku]BAM39948.1 conserved hypothetical protein [Theileria orientalis strain Shintoku]|eukprot:XP_009690249.1 conserved hypothetical protein [Theileria orientalis strain Shintoku]